MLNQLKLGPKFMLLLSLVFVIVMMVSGLTLWATIRYEAEEDITTRAELLTQTMNAVRGYTSDHVQPLLEKQLLTEPQFIKETVPAFSARSVFESFRNHPEYSSFHYKEATPNPTNPEDLADDFETELFEQFQFQPNLSVLSGYRAVENRKLYYTARPLILNEASCLQCHSTPAAAPKSQLATYGDKMGFGWQMNDVIAVQTIYVPADEVISHGWHNLTLIMTIFGTIFATAILVINRLLKLEVIQPIKQLTVIARHLGGESMTPEQVQEFETPTIARVAQGADEPGQLARTFQVMAREVAEREQRLNQAVADRTVELAARTQEAQQANEAKSQFLSTMSHELRTPLNIILGFSQLMKRNDTLDVTQQTYINTINRSGEHLLSLINNVLDLAKIEAGKTTLTLADTDLNSLLDWIHSMFQYRADSKGIHFTIERSGVLPNKIHCDEGKLRQILVNLVGNAVKFTHIGSVTLRVSGSDIANQLLFSVEDTGIGISPDEISMLFQPFVQTKAGRKMVEGTGLGLAIVQQFVELMDGKLSVQSQLGQGTTFQFSIQVQFIEHEEPQFCPIQQQIIGLAPGQPRYRILVMGAELEQRQLLVDLLVSVGFDVQEAVDGQNAITVASVWKPHLIWMDLQLPNIDAYEAACEIKGTIFPAPIIIVLSGLASEAERVVSLKTGYDEFVLKPFHIETIFEKIARYLGISYTYKSVSSDRLTSTPSKSEVHSIHSELQVMPKDWLEAVCTAATRVNAKLIFTLIEQIPQEHKFLRESLKTLVNDFDFSTLVELTQSRD